MTQKHGEYGGSITAHVRGYLGKISYPTDKAHLIEVARNQDAGDRIVRTLQQLPDTLFNSFDEVMVHFTGGRVGERSFGGGAEGPMQDDVLGTSHDLHQGKGEWKAGMESSGQIGDSAKHDQISDEERHKAATELLKPSSDHKKLDALAATRSKPSQAEGERDFDEELDVRLGQRHNGRDQEEEERDQYRPSDDEGRSQSP
ncbi:MAG: DUF2795 domain-containing protein [Bradymonadaceae bacterium]|nr:DUF2795 domain-containing protein [Lujinxingiaceae bacterium]